MNRKNLAVVLLVSIVALSCQDDNPTKPVSSLVVRNGTSYGECAGYCKQELTIDGTQAVLVRQDLRDPQNNPDITVTVTITQGEWSALVKRIDDEAIAKLPDVLGCPDCADGGAEWIVVERNGQRHSVMFEAGMRIEPIAELLDAVRVIRRQLNESTPR